MMQKETLGLARRQARRALPVVGLSVNEPNSMRSVVSLLIRKHR